MIFLSDLVNGALNAGHLKRDIPDIIGWVSDPVSVKITLLRHH